MRRATLKDMLAIALLAAGTVRPAHAQWLERGSVMRSESTASAVPLPRPERTSSGTARAERAAAQRPVCDFSGVPGAVWWGSDRQMSLERLAAYVAPVYWFSPDEPSLQGRHGADIRLPEIIPGEPFVDRPVVYYQFDEIVSRADGDGPAYRPGPSGHADGSVDLHNTAVLTLGIFAYFRDEVGLGAHPHDLEATAFKVSVVRDTARALREYSAPCDVPSFVIVVTRTSAKAHGLQLFWNVVETDQYTSFPMHLLVEEGKHGIATDKNGDGYFTPGYDVNVRINDAWGVRDNMATGLMATGKYEAWMTKVRRDEDRVLPPLPDDSPWRPEFERRTAGASLAVYELRPLPSSDIAGDDEGLRHIIHGHEVRDWPRLGELTSAKQWESFIAEGTAIKSLSIAFRADGDLGFSFVFPFFIVKHLTDPMTGGYIVQRMYLKDRDLQDFGWMAMYTPSASRWMDTYLAAGAERDATVDSLGVKTSEWDFVFETGLKFRVNMQHSPLKFLSVLTPYWGLRAGIKNRGFFDINRLTYVIELGAGSF